MTLTFTSQNWQTPQTVTVTAAASPDGTGFFSPQRLEHSVTSNDPNYNNLLVVPVLVTTGDPSPIVPVIPISVVAPVAGGTDGSVTVTSAKPVAGPLETKTVPHVLHNTSTKTKKTTATSHGATTSPVGKHISPTTSGTPKHRKKTTHHTGGQSLI
jgi:hypothetical protein